MVALTNVILFVAAATATVLPRDFSTVQADLKKINTDTQTLIQKTKAYNGGVSNAIPVQNAFNAVDNDIKQATTDSKNSAMSTPAQAQTLIDYINKTLEPSTSAAITATINKKAKFTADGLAGTVCSNLQTLQKDENALGAALLAKTPSGKKSAANAAQAKVAADINRGIKAFC